MLIHWAGAVSKQSRVGLWEPEAAWTLLEPQFSHLLYGYIGLLGLWSPSVLNSVTLCEKSVISRIRTHLCQLKFYVKGAPESDGEKGISWVLYLFSQTIMRSLMGQIHLFCMARECFSHKLVWLMAVRRCQQAAYGSRGR